MTVYNTYTEAKLANQDKDIVTTGKGWVGTKKNKGKFAPAVKDGVAKRIGDDYWVICNPSDHCTSLEAFFEAGHKLVVGDCFINISGVVVFISEDNKYINNSRDNSDKECFVLSAKALEEAEVEQVEWNGEGLPPVGAKCEFEYPKGNWNGGYYHGKTSSGSVKMHILEYEGGRLETLGGLAKFRKPETPEQKKERELLEAAYNLYTTYQSAIGLSCINITDFNENSEWHMLCKGFVAIVRETGYRKPE